MTGVTARGRALPTETFGPIVGVARFATFDEAIELANGHGYGLSSAIYTTSPTHAFRFRERISAGMVSINNSTSGAEAHLPFGGNGKSGNGSRQSGIWVLDQFTRWQSMNWDYAGKLQKAQMDLVEIEADSRVPPRLGVGPEQVVQAGDGRLAADGSVSAVMVVAVDPAVKGGGAFPVGAVERSVGPAAEHGADQALGFAVGLRSPGPGA